MVWVDPGPAVGDSPETGGAGRLPLGGGGEARLGRTHLVARLAGVPLQALEVVGDGGLARHDLLAGPDGKGTLSSHAPLTVSTRADTEASGDAGDDDVAGLV